MKKSMMLFVLICTLFVWQGCGSKAKENNETAAAEADEKAAEAKKKEEIAAKRARIEKLRIEKEAQRKLAAEELAKANLTYKDASGKIVYNKAEVNPSYPGGDEAMRKFLQDNLVYPSDASDRGVEGTVFVDFVVGANGQVRDVVSTDAAWEDVDPTLQVEAERVVKAMPAWVPGRQRGKTVDAKFSIPITFQLTSF